MKRVLIITLLSTVLMREVVAQSRAVTNAPAKIELSDQFEVKQSLVFPTTNLTFLVIADKVGSEQLAAWVSPVKERFGEAAAIVGIADVSAVPRPMRGLVRKKFKKSQAHSVMLDWSGETVKAFACAPERANVFVLDDKGRIVKRLTGKATPEGIKEVCQALEQAWAETRKDRVANR